MSVSFDDACARVTRELPNFPAAGYGVELPGVWVVCTRLPDGDTDQLLVKVPKSGVGPLVTGIYPEWMFELRGAPRVGAWPSD